MKPLTDDHRRLVILIKLYQKEHREGPKWSWLMEQTGHDRKEIRRLLRQLRNRKCVIFKDGVANSTIATKRGVEAALNPQEQQAPLDGALSEA